MFVPTMPSVRTQVRQRLRIAIRPLHDSLHHHPAVTALLCDHATPLVYRELLGRLYGIYTPLEREIELARPHLERDLRRSMQPRARLLLSDLAALGLSAGEIARIATAPNIAAMTTREEALGAVYVLQGSAIGGRAIAGRLRRGDLSQMPMRFFEGCPQDHNTWRLCCDALERCATAGDINRLTNAAVSTFRHFVEWLEALRNGPTRREMAS